MSKSTKPSEFQLTPKAWAGFPSTFHPTRVRFDFNRLLARDIAHRQALDGGDVEVGNALLGAGQLHLRQDRQQ